MLLCYPPHKLLSGLVANLKATSSKVMWREFQGHTSAFYSKKVFWTGSYFVASCGGVTIETLKQYVQNQTVPDSSRR
ncbi:MAG: IS200/IS605 family transposase [Chroococcales cyanobacterium]